MSKDNIYTELFVTFIVVLVFSIIIFAFVNVAWQSTKTVANLGSSGLISSGELFFFGDGGKQQQSIEWGELSPDETKQVSVPITEKMSNIEYYLSTQNWSPKEAEQYFELSMEKVAGNITFTLHVLPNVENITEFSFDVIVTGTV